MAEKEQVEGRSTSTIEDTRSGKEVPVEDMLKNLKLIATEEDRLVDEEEEETEKAMWALVGKILSEPKVYHISTISAALRPTWGNPKGLFIRDGGKNLGTIPMDGEQVCCGVGEFSSPESAFGNEVRQAADLGTCY